MTTTTPLRPLTTPLDGGLSGAGRPSHLWVPIAVAFAGYPILWMFGLGLFAYPLAGLLALAGLMRRDGTRLELPPQVGVWVLFVLWTLTAVFVIHEPDRAIAFVYRTSMYVTAGALLVWVMVADRERLTDRSVLRSVSALWFATVIGGLLGMVLPGVEITTPIERMLPAAALEIGLIENIVHLQFADASRFLGFTVGRPEAPFPYTNAWGSAFALLTPVVLATWGLGATRRWRFVTGTMVALATIPWVASLNRGSWLSLSAGLAYVAIRRVREVPLHKFLGAVAAVAALVLIVLTSPLGTLVSARTDGPGHSDEGRALLYGQAIDLTIDSPIIGWGAPQPNRIDPEDPSIGTHGQLWLLLVSHGVPAAALYLTFFGLGYIAAFRWRAPYSVWLEGVLVIGAIQFPIYELLPDATLILAVIAALCIRGHRHQQAQDRRHLHQAPT